MPPDGKQAKAKETKQAQPALAPQPQEPVQEVRKEIVIPLRITVGKEFKSKLPFLLGLLLLFTFALIMFDKSNFKTTDLSDMQRVQYNMPKLYSLSFILFIILFSLSLALGVYYAIGLGWLSSLLVIPATIIPSLILGLIFFPWLTSTFLALSATISFTAILASFWPKFSISRAWTALSIAMIIFSLLAFFVVFYKVAENKDVHIDLFLNSLVAQSQGGGVGNIVIPAQVISSSVSKDDFSSFITQNDVREILLASYPNFASLSDSEKELAIQSFHSKIIELGYSAFQKNSGLVAQALGNSLSARFASGAEALKQQIYLLPQFKLIYDRYALLTAAIAALVASFIALFIQLIALGFLFALHKLAPSHP
ncbi:MAG TPA: hypothetical protein VI875_02470 [Candidatus Norongarragalinales archaeon]|nr:hypothetical protein [Candidatus Norongarragalinales archaeon]